jgi:hypothetical protein
MNAKFQPIIIRSALRVFTQREGHHLPLNIVGRGRICSNKRGMLLAGTISLIYRYSHQNRHSHGHCFYFFIYLMSRERVIP